MPIRFRCEHCHQLLGIARRKAGSQVDCPKCSKATTVPEQEVPIPVTSRAPADAPLLERPDFDELLNDPKIAAGGVSILGAKSGPPPVDQKAPSSKEKYDVDPVDPATLTPSAPVGVVLTSQQAKWLTVVAIVCMALSFGAGLLVGRFLL